MALTHSYPVGSKSSTEFLAKMISRFDQLMVTVEAQYDVETLAPRVHVIRPRQNPVHGPEGKDVVVTISALIHGVEVAGLAVVVEFLEIVARGAVKLDGAVGVVIGNVPAAKAGVRFVERDLNRSFGRSDTKTAEDRRADELERLFARTWRLFDIHQVKLPIDRPFWIFPYTKAGYQFARAVAPDVTLITHWGKGFSQDGKCSDEWVNSVGGSGVTLELGQNGFDPAQIERGLEAVCRAVEVATSAAKGTRIPVPAGRLAPIYTWGEIVPYPHTGKPVLDAGWHNFRMVGAGERLGEFGGQVITA